MKNWLAFFIIFLLFVSHGVVAKNPEKYTPIFNTHCEMNGLKTEKDFLLPVCIKGKTGYINGKGQLIVKAKYDSGESFSEGLAVVKFKEKYGYINTQGKEVIKPQFGYAANFSEGLGGVSVNEHYGFINKTGKFIIKPRFNPPRMDEWDGPVFSENVAAVYENGNCGYINKAGKYVIPSQYLSCFDFVYGKAHVMPHNQADDASGFYINPSNKPVKNIKWCEFSEGLTPEKLVDPKTNTEKFGYINQSGIFVIKPQFDVAFYFSEGLAAIGFYQKGDSVKVGFINKTGKLTIKPQFTYTSYKMEGSKLVYLEGGQPFFHNGVAKVYIGDKYGYIDKTGRWIWKPTK